MDIQNNINSVTNTALSNKADINNVENSWQGLEKHQLVLENYLNKINKTEVMN